MRQLCLCDKRKVTFKLNDRPMEHKFDSTLNLFQTTLKTLDSLESIPSPVAGMPIEALREKGLQVNQCGKLN